MTQPDSSRRVPAATSRVAHRLDKQLLSYASAAAAAGVSLLAVSQVAEAKIVYTAANVTMPTNAFTNLDMNNDGIPDFNFYFYAYGPRKPLGYHEEYIEMDPLKTGNAIWGVPDSKVGECAAALPRGVKVGAGAAFQAQQLPVWGSNGTAYSGPYTVCGFAGKVHGAFLGLRFVINGQTHYGWAHLTVSRRNAVLSGYAYETVPNQPIHTGQTSGPVSDVRSDITFPLPSQRATLGLLAQGSRGLSIWRRPDEQGQVV
ncbi:MAG TPA: hypothetical protein VMH04_04350 [Candidatus Solibacter sp.]|nr:hypothetical protein [Candidatus Solibacter sp.]